MRAASVNRRRILGLWLPRLPTDRIERRFPRSNGAPAEEARPPRVVAAKRDNALVVVACDARATQGGLMPGMPLATARAMHPALDIVDHDPHADVALLDGDRRLVRPLHAAWWRATAMTACCSTSPAARICSATRRRCCARWSTR